jgi:2-methylisocitrate lyase-like PEP mutase family enzyme
MSSAAKRLRDLFDKPGLIVTPCCHDALSMRLIEQAGFDVAFMSGFGVAATRFDLPDTGLISYAEVLDQGRNICTTTTLPVFGDGDTGYGNALNVKRTVKGFAKAGFAAIMIEDQVSPKRCGHTKGKQVVSRDEAFMRIHAVVDARRELQADGFDIVILGRTDARTTDGLDEAIDRVKGYEEIGADMVFLEAPTNTDEMQAFTSAVSVPTLANMLDGGSTPILSPPELEQLGFKFAAYPLTLHLAMIPAMEKALNDLNNGQLPNQGVTFQHLQKVAGFPEYYEMEKRYKDSDQ